MAIYDLKLSLGSDLILDTLCQPEKIFENDAIVQISKQHLKLWVGNWFRDISRGTDWLAILRKKVNRNGIVQIISESLLQLSFVTKVIDVYVDINKITRQAELTYIFEANGEQFTNTEIIQ